MFYLKEMYVIGHGVETAQKLTGSTPHDQLLIQISNSFAGLLLFVVGFLLFMVAFVKDAEFQSFFAKGVCLYMYRWLCGGSFLREGLKIWLGIGLDRWLVIWLWRFLGYSFWFTLGGRSMIEPLKF